MKKIVYGVIATAGLIFSSQVFAQGNAAARPGAHTGGLTVNAQDVASDVECGRLPTLNFNANINYVQDEQVEDADLPPRRKARGGGTRTGDYDYEFQNNADDVIINITRRNPYTNEREEVQILDDTGLFSTYLSGLTLVSKLNAGQPVSEKEVETLKNYLDKLDDTMDDLDSSIFSTNHAQNSLEQIDDILDVRPINASDLYTELHKMTYLSTELSSQFAAGLMPNGPNSGSAVIQGYIRSKKENGQWSSWSIYRGPEYWHSGKWAGREVNANRDMFSREKWRPEASMIHQHRISASSQFFVALLERARTDDGTSYLCSPALAQSTINVQPMAVGHKRTLVRRIINRVLPDQEQNRNTRAGAK